jgi:transposase
MSATKLVSSGIRCSTSRDRWNLFATIDGVDSMAKRGRPAADIRLTGAERRQLERWAHHRCGRRALAMRSRIILACADPAGFTGREIADRVGCNPATVSKWRRRFAERRLDGLRDEPRPGARRTIGDDVIEQVMIDTLETTPPHARHWSTRSMAVRHGISRQKVSEIWRAFGVNSRAIDEPTTSLDP